MYWCELINAIILGSAALIVAACKRWRFLYIIVCAVGSIAMPLGFSACIYDAATGKAAHKALLWRSITPTPTTSAHGSPARQRSSAVTRIFWTLSTSLVEILLAHP